MWLSLPLHKKFQLPQRKSNFFWFILAVLTVLCQSSRHTGCSYLLQRVERFISNHFKDHFWQFNTVLQFVAPSVKRFDGQMSAWLQGVSVTPLISYHYSTDSIYPDNTLIQNIKLFKRLKDTWYRFLLLKQYEKRRSPGKETILITHSRNRTGVKNKLTTYSALTS